MRAVIVAIIVGVATALGVVSVITVTSGCSADWNKPHPITPEPGNPCGVAWISCGNGACCKETHSCRADGYCSFDGNEPPLWAATRDGGARAPYRQLSPSEVRRGGSR